MEEGTLEVYVSIFNVSVFRNLFRELRSNIGLHQMLVFGIEETWLKKPRDFGVLTSSTAFFSRGECNASAS